MLQAMTAVSETFISGTAVSSDYFDRTGKYLVEEIAARVHMDLVVKVLQVLEDRLARTLAMIINTIDLDAIVFGGGLSNLERLYKNVRPKWPRLVFSKDIDTLLASQNTAIPAVCSWGRHGYGLMIW